MSCLVAIIHLVGLPSSTSGCKIPTLCECLPSVCEMSTKSSNMSSKNKGPSVDGSPPKVTPGEGSSSNAPPNHDASNTKGTNQGKSDGEAPTKPTFADLFRDNRKPNDKCALVHTPLEGNELSLSFDEIDSVDDAIGCCLVGCMVGRKLNGYIVRELIKKWGKKVTFKIHESGWITFIFENEDDRQLVMSGGPYLIYGRYLYLKLMPRCFLFRVEDMLSLPTWVQIHGLPLDCWTTTALSKVASVVGKPLHTDQITQTRGKLGFARVLVEVDATIPKIYEYPINLPTGDRTTLRYVYETDPKFCTNCNVLGHSWDNCFRNKTNKEEVPNNEEPQVGGVVGEDVRRDRSWSRQPRRRGRHFRGARGDRGRGRGRGNGVGGGRGDDAMPDMDSVDREVADYDAKIKGNDGKDEITNNEMEDEPIEDEISFEVAPFEGGEKFVVEVFQGELDEEGFEEVTSKKKRRAIRYMKRLKGKEATSSTSSNSTEYIEVDPRSWLPRMNARTIIMSQAQAKARRLKAASSNQ